MNIISVTVVPPNGWDFQEGKYQIKGETYYKLLANVLNHRKSNGKEIGDAAHDIQTQLAIRYPHLKLLK